LRKGPRWEVTSRYGAKKARVLVTNNQPPRAECLFRRRRVAHQNVKPKRRFHDARRLANVRCEQRVEHVGPLSELDGSHPSELSAGLSAGQIIRARPGHGRKVSRGMRQLRGQTVGNFPRLLSARIN
jgi:hypothetical protein